MKRGDGLVVFLELRIQVANKIISVGFIGEDFSDVFEGGDAVSEVSQIFVREAEVVPGVRIARELLCGGEKLVAAGFGFLLIEEGDAEIQAGDGEFWVGLQSLLKKFLGVGGALLVEISDAEGVQAQRLGGIVGQGRLWRLSGCRGAGGFLLRTRG